MTPPLRRPTKLFRGPSDAEAHARKAMFLGITPEDHARLSYLVLHRELDLAALKGLRGDALAHRVLQIWGGPGPGAPPGGPG